jgi:hypothetical protein
VGLIVSCVLVCLLAAMQIFRSDHLDYASVPSGLLIGLCLMMVAMLIGFGLFELALIAARALTRFEVISKYLK